MEQLEIIKMNYPHLGYSIRVKNKISINDKSHTFQCSLCHLVPILSKDSPYPIGAAPYDSVKS